MFGGSGYPGSVNADVLSAEPADAESKHKLVEEIKSRAKGCITARNYPEAVALYTKAINLTVEEPAARAVLHGNRSMVQLSMSKVDEAMVDANEAIRLDPSYLKAYYRKAMAATAQNNYALARQALQAGLAIKPDEKELLSQLQKVDEKLSVGVTSSTTAVPAAIRKVAVCHAGKTASSSSSSSSAEAPSKATVPKSSSSSSSSSRSSSSQKGSKKEGEQKKKGNDDDDDNDNDAADSTAANLRGYRKTADGRTTTFFNHEMDEQTKALIGDIKPKKLEAIGEVITTNNTAGSAWNAAGTYEEKVLTPWVSTYLSDAFASINITLTEAYIPPTIRAAVPDAVTIIIESTSAENVSGHAQVTHIRGKKKHMCDFSATIKWSVLITFAGDRPPAQVTGTIAVEDITADREFETDGFAVTKLNDVATTLGGLPGDVAAVINRAAKASDSPLQQEILRKLDAFWTELKSK